MNGPSKHPTDEVQRLRRQLAESAMIVDLLAELPNSHTQEQAVQALLGLAEELCAPRCVGFVPPTGQRYSEAVVRPSEEGALELVETTAAALGESRRWISVGTSFAVSVNAGADRCGVLAVVDVASPQDIDEYGQLLRTMAGPLALVIANARFQSALVESETNYRLLAENATDIVWRLDGDSIMVWVSPSLESVLGWRPDQLLGTRPRELTHPDDREVLTVRRGDTLNRDTIPEFEIRIQAADGDYRWMSVQTRPTQDVDGSVDGVIVGLRDIHDQVSAREALERSEGLFRMAMDGSPQGMAVVGLDLRFLQVNPALGDMLGREEAWLLAHTLRDVIHPDDLDSDLAGNGELFVGTAQRIVREGRWLRADGSTLWVMHSTSLLRDEHHRPLFQVSHIQDNTEAHERTAELTYRASHDPLTGLMNRDQLEERIAADLLFKPRRSGVTGLLFCDLDYFKAINDTYGHAAGDDVLRAVAQRMAQVLRAGDTIARIGGDEFVIVLGQVYDLPTAGHVAQKVRAAVSEPITIEGNQVVTITASVGVALATPGIDAHRLLRNADAAVYEAKNSGRNQIAVYDVSTPRMETDTGERSVHE
ncbi:MAG: diguanylate cyclase [Actinomycetes bacterium]